MGNHLAECEQVINHIFPQKICSGKISDKALCIYLDQDKKYVLAALKAILKTAYLCPVSSDRVKINKQIGFFANSDTNYSSSTIKQCLRNDPTLENYLKPDFIIPEAKAYINFVRDIAGRDDRYSYAQMVTFLWANDYLYLKWAERCSNYLGSLPSESQKKYQTIAELYSNENMRQWVSLLEEQVNKTAASLDEVSSIFKMVAKHEFLFFEGCNRYD